MKQQGESLMTTTEHSGVLATRVPPPIHLPDSATGPRSTIRRSRSRRSPFIPVSPVRPSAGRPRTVGHVHASNGVAK
jgi:hypothetical protein